MKPKVKKTDEKLYRDVERPEYLRRKLTLRDEKIIKELYERKQNFIKVCIGDKKEILPTHAFVTTTEPIIPNKWQGHGKTPAFIDETVPAGHTLKVVMISRFGDFGLTDDLSAEHGYHTRVPLDAASIKNLRWKP